DVGEGAGRDHSDLVIPAEQISRIDRRGLNRLNWSQSPFDHVRELFGVPSMRINSGVRAECELHSGARGLLKILSLRATDHSLFLDYLFGVAELGELGQDVIVVVDVGDQISPALFHHLDAFVVNQAAVFDRGHAGADGALDAFRAVGVSGYALAPHFGFFDYGVHLFLRKLRRADRLFFGEHARRRDHLDQISAVFDLEANQLANLADAVGEAGETAEFQIRREAVGVAVSAGRAHGECGDLHSRAYDVAAVDGVAQRHVNEFARAHVAHGGESGFERAARVDMRDDGHVNRAFAEDVFVIIARLKGHVRVAINQAGRHCLVFQVNDFDFGGNRHVRAYGGDLLAFDQNEGVVCDRAGLRVNQPPRFDGDAFRRLFLFRRLRQR